MTKVMVELDGPEGWHVVGEVTDAGPLGSLASDEPVGRQVYMFGFLPDEPPGVWRSIAGADFEVEAESARVIHSVALDRVADLTWGAFELEVWNAAGPRRVRFRLDRLAPGFYVNDAGELHVDVPAVLRSQGIEPTPENIDHAAELLAQSARDYSPETEVQVEDVVRFDGPCPFLTCLDSSPHDHPVCPDCGAVRYGNMFCATCRREGA